EALRPPRANPTARLLVAALRVREDRTLFLVRELVERGIERARRLALPEENRRHARAHHRRAVLAALADRAVPVRVEAVAEGSARTVCQEAVLPLPAAAVARVVRVDEDVPAPLVARRAVGGRAEPVDALPLVLQPAVEVVVVPVDPVGLDHELGQVAGEV